MAHRYEEQPRDLYTIPVSSSWFSWDAIHDVERQSLPEFFNHSSYSRNPRVYKEYRDFIINKFREDSSRKLTFTEVRKSLIGDVGSVEKVFRWLDKWGLINFGVKNEEGKNKGGEDNVVVEEGPPVGIKVVPASLKLVGHGGGDVGGTYEGGSRLPGLSSYVDVFGERKGLICGVCGDKCDLEGLDSVKSAYAVCSKCSKNETKNKEEKPVDDLNSQKSLDGNASNHFNTTTWTDPETLLLLEAVLKHGDDWDLIAQHVRTKTKHDCIARLIHLPFGDPMLSHVRNKMDNYSSNSGGSEVTQAGQDLIKEEQSEEPLKTDEHGQKNEVDENKADKESSPERPSKRICLPSFTDVTETLMEQVALLSTVSGPHVAAAAAEAAVVTLCNENPCAQNAFETYESAALSSKDEMESDRKFEDQDMMRNKASEPSVEKSFGATTYRIRASVATALGAAAARAKLLADQELREMELLMASIIETQLKKMKIKMKHFEELELIMEKEYAQIQQLKESTIEEWTYILQQTTRAGNGRWKDSGLPKLLVNTNL